MGLLKFNYVDDGDSRLMSLGKYLPYVQMIVVSPKRRQLFTK